VGAILLEPEKIIFSTASEQVKGILDELAARFSKIDQKWITISGPTTLIASWHCR